MNYRLHDGGGHVDGWPPAGHAGGMADSVWQDDRCPGCDGDLRSLGFLLCRRQEDQKRVCRMPFWCRTCETVWSRWADRADPLEREELFPESLLRSIRGR
ncbi:hypothetical protein [Actinoplanes sp. NPDC026623]|uniref:hypothetical protein n=1 Tax=Actinoplanes sp. NPDC026623 TaxID=3155610 RepID=UPI0033DAE599